LCNITGRRLRSRGELPVDAIELVLLTLTALTFLLAISFGIYAFAPAKFFSHAAAHGRYQWLNR